VTRKLLDVSTLPHGPRDPMVAPPPRRPGSVRRTTTIDKRRGAPGAPLDMEARGRDLLTRHDGSTVVTDAAVFRATVSATGTISAIEADPPEPALAGLVGAHVSRGFRAKVDVIVPHHREAGSVLHQLLDDVPMAALISNYGWSREADDFELSPDVAGRLTDLCAGWEAGGTMLDVLGRTGVFPIPVGPTAPDLTATGDPLAWHAVEPLVPRSVRRWRRLDLLLDAPLVLDVHYRDCHLGAEEPEDVLHEYQLSATVDPTTLCVLTSVATPRVLPWPECPGALASAARIVGLPVADLRERVLAELTGTSTCTHLNDLLRSLAGVPTLVRAATR
jgi:hypothetical protein